MKSRLAVPGAAYLKPLLFGLDRADSPFDLVVDFPSKNALKLNERSEEIRSAFLSPIDYARHGGEYCILPNICVASSIPTNTIQLILKSDLRNIETIAVDIRVTSEIILAKIILTEKFRNQSGHSQLQFLPMMPDVDIMLAKADAALIIDSPPEHYQRPGTFTIDLVEEWNDMTELPYVHGFWVGREEELSEQEAAALVEAHAHGKQLRTQIAQTVAQQTNRPLEEISTYIDAFTYTLDQRAEESIEEFIQYAYYHGVIGDVPELQYFDLQPPSGVN